MAQGRTGVEIELSFFPLAIFFFACTPRVQIGAIVHEAYWGTHFFPLPAGKHKIDIFFRYLFLEKCGPAGTGITVTEGKVVKLKYYKSPLIWADGSLERC